MTLRELLNRLQTIDKMWLDNEVVWCDRVGATHKIDGVDDPYYKSDAVLINAVEGGAE